MPLLDNNPRRRIPCTRVVEMELGMNPIYQGLVGERIYNKLIQTAYDQKYTGSHDNLLDAIQAYSQIVEIVKQAIVDVIQSELEVLATREEAQTHTWTLFMSGLLHAQNVIAKDESLIGKIDLE